MFDSLVLTIRQNRSNQGGGQYGKNLGFQAFNSYHDDYLNCY